MSRRIRQWIGIASAVIAYYLVHEGAHFLYAIYTGVFKPKIPRNYTQVTG